MQTILILAIAALVFWTVAYTFYWGMLRPSLAAKLRYSIIQLEAQVTTMFLDADRISHSRRTALKLLLQRCKRALHAVDRCSIGATLLVEVSDEISAEIKRERITLDAADSDVRKINDEVSNLMFFGILTNSPQFFLLGLILSATAHVFGRIRNLYRFVIAHAEAGSISMLTPLGKRSAACP